MNVIAPLLRQVTSALKFLKRIGTKRPWVASIVAVLIVGGIGFALFAPKDDVGDSGENQSTTRSVRLIPVSVSGNAPRAEAGSEVVLRAETSGKIVRALPAGTRVAIGTVVAEFEKASQQAALLQAEGALEAAQAALEKTRGGLRSEKLAVLEAAYQGARSTTVTTLLSAYGAVDSAVRDTADQMFSNPESSRPQLTFASSNSQRRINIETARVSLGAVLARQQSASNALTGDSSLEAELDVTEGELRTARAFLDEVIGALNEALPTGVSGSVSEADIAAYKAAATASRTALTTALGSVSSARASLETAAQNRAEGLTGAEAVDLAAGEATVKQAQGAYDAALASFQKTQVRAAVPGTVLSCSAQVGDVLSVGADVCRLRTAGGSLSGTFSLPLSSVKYTPSGAFVFTVSAEGVLDAVPVTTTVVTAEGITVVGLLGDESVVEDVRGLRAGDRVTIVE